MHAAEVLSQRDENKIQTAEMTLLRSMVRK
jgi:hypothetical protein